MNNSTTIATVNRAARAKALVHLMVSTPGNTPRMARLADKVFGAVGWNWASLYYRASLVAGTWE